MIFILAACGGKQSKVTKANLVILGGIASGIPGMTGGTKIFGYNNSTGDTLNLTYTGQGAITVPNGVWDFAAITWDGNTINGTGQVMEGDTLCGTSDPIALFGGEVAIDITLSNLGCSDEFFGSSETKESNGEPKLFRPFRCLTDKEVHDDYQACSPSVAESFQVQLPDGAFGGPGLTTRCIDADTPSGVPEMVDSNGELRIPIFGWFDNSFPIRVRLFDGAGCSGTSQDIQINNAYAGLSQPFAARLESGTVQGDGLPNDVRLHNDPCLHGEGTGPAPFNASPDFIICTEAQFEGVSGIEANLSGSYQLNRDLDFSLSSPFATSLVSGTFTGELHGNGHTISNVTIVATNQPSLGIFEHIFGTPGTTNIEDLSLVNIDIDATDSSAVGALAGYVSPDTMITGVQGQSIDIDLNRTGGTHSGVGGLFGITNIATLGTPIQMHAIKLTDVSISVDIDYSNIGGVIGQMSSGSFLRLSKISNISIQGKNGNENGTKLGGAVGFISSQDTEIYGVIVENLSIGTAGTRFSPSFDKIGGVVGEANNSRVIDSKASGSIYAAGDAIGGFAGKVWVDSASGSVFDGNISDVYIDHITGINVGGFAGDIYNGTASSVFTLENNRSLGDIDCATDCGGFAGRAFLNDNTATIDIKKSYSKSDVSSSSGLGTANIGGFIGFVNNNIAGTLNIMESFSEGDVLAPGAGKVGGFIGRSDKPTITDSFYRGTVTGSGADVGGFIGNALTTSLNRVFSSGVLPAGKECIGQSAGGMSLTDTYYESGSDSDADCPVITGGFRTSAQIVDRSTLTNFVATTWDDIDSTTPIELNYAEKLKSVGESYTGSFFDPIILITAAQWNAISDTPEFMKKTYMLGSDISFGGADCGAGFEPIGSTTNPFVGSFKGNNFIISDISCIESAGTEPLGLFRNIFYDTNYGTGQIEDFELFDDSSGKALYIENVSFTTDQGDVGTLVGSVTDSGTAGNPHDHRMAFKAYKIYVSNGYISQTGAFKAGGLIGNMNLTNDNSHVIRSGFKGTVSRGGSATGTGGLFGAIGGGPLSASYDRKLDFAVLSFEGDILGTADSAGGVIGILNHPQMEMAYAGATLTATINSTGNSGGFVGLHSDGMIRNSFAKGDVSCNAVACNAGGFAGRVDGSTGEVWQYGNYAESSSVTSTGGGSYAGCYAGDLFSGPRIYNNYANCASVTGPTSSYFSAGGFSLVNGSTQAKNAFTAPSLVVITGADYLSYDEILDPTFVGSNTELVISDPWIHLEGDSPRLFWEIYPELLGE